VQERRNSRRRADRFRCGLAVRIRTGGDVTQVAPVHDAVAARPTNPALLAHARERAQSFENRVADRITSFAGSMRFVYLHAIWFACWIGLGVEAYPFGLLTMIVSLEAIFLSTFVMISQNRADAKREVLANQQWATVQEEDRQNDELLELSRQILELTKQAHAEAAARTVDARRRES
jgi:uncharacterized membrane protein